MMETAIIFGVYETNVVFIKFLDKSLVSISSLVFDLCPEIELEIINEDESPLNSAIFTYDTESLKFTIDSQDPAVVGTYYLKIVARFSGDRYS